MAWKKNGSPGRRSGTADPDIGRRGRHIAGGDAGRTLLRERGLRDLNTSCGHQIPCFQPAFLSRNEAKNASKKKK